eukprot:c24243_g1_i1 orf=197-2134(+)
MASLLNLTSTFISLCSFSVLVSGATFTLVNRCSYIVWPAIYTVSGGSLGSLTPFGISPDNNNSVEVPSPWNGRFWGRTGCSFNSSDEFVCDNGNCGGLNNSIECKNDGTNLPVTLAEFLLGAVNNLSYYNLSVVGGFNLPLTISPTMLASKNASSPTCGSPSCIADALPQCPAKLLRVSNKGTPLACSSACSVFQTDQSCCTGNYSSDSACAANNYTQVFKNFCPTAYTTPYNGATYTCCDADFTITFCSDGNFQSSSPPLSPGLPSHTPGIGTPISRVIPPSHPPLQPVTGQSKHSISRVLMAGVGSGIVVIVGVTFVCLILKQRIQQKSESEPNISDIGPQRFKYKELHSATKGFNPSALLGQGAQGQVYKGILGRGGVQVAIKKVAADKAGRGMSDLISELRIISELRHRNLVELQGWCKHKGELLVVYDYMPNGSLDKLLFPSCSKPIIDWHVRYRIICGLGTALAYLHEEGGKRVVHRDVKPSNIMLDANFEPKLGDFGLARVVDHGVIPRSTTAAGTIGYLAPEIAMTRLPTAESDVYSFGIVALEVICGRPSFQIASESGSIFLLDKVRDLSRQGRLMEAVDSRLAGGFNHDEMERLLFVGLAATDSDPKKRPTMRQILAVLTKQAPATLEEMMAGCS